MKLRIWTALFLLEIAQFGWGQTNGNSNLVSEKATASEPSANGYTVLGATPQQEGLVHIQIHVMQPAAYPLRIIFVPHWKYIDTARTFRLHVPTGYASAMFTHLPSRSIFIDSDRYVNDDSLGYWLAHELGHLTTNRVSESDADKAAREYRKRLKDAREASPDETAVRNIIQEEITAWNSGDATAYSLHFAADGTFTNIRGQFFTGRQPFIQKHDDLFKGPFHGSTLKQDVISLKFVRPDVAIVEVLTSVTGIQKLSPGTNTDERGRLRTRLLQVLVKEGGEWNIVAYHNTDVKADVPAPDPR